MKKGLLIIRTAWQTSKGRLKQSIAGLTNNDMLYQEGQREEMAARLQSKLNKPLKELFEI